MKLKISMVSSLAVLFLLVILSGCVTPESTSTTTPIQTETPASIPTELSLRIGETAKAPGIEVTVISANITDKILFRCSRGGSGDTEESMKGEIFVIADVEIKNTGNKGIVMGYGSFWNVIDSAGFVHSQYYGTPVSYCEGDYLETGDLYPDRVNRGRIIFKLPTEAKGLKIVLDANLFSTSDYKRLFTNVKSVSWALK